MSNSFIPISYSDFLCKAALDTSVNFIAFVITPWHAISLDASVKYLQSKGIELNGMVLVYPHDKTGINVSIESFTCDCYSIYVENGGFNQNSTVIASSKEKNLCKSSFLKRRIKHLSFYKYALLGGRNVQKLPEIYLMQTVHPEPQIGLQMLSYGRYMRYVCFDEGVGTYTPDNDIPPTSYKIGEWANYFREAIIGHQWLKYFHHVIYTTLFEDRKGILYPRQSVVPYYRQVIEDHASQSSLSIDLSDAVIIAPSVYEEIKQYYNGEEMRIWSQVCATLSKKGYKLYMKPHPRDSYFRQYAHQWKCELIEVPNLPMEKMCAISQPKCIVAGPSTALVTSNLLYEIPAICIYDLMDQSKCDQSIKTIIKYFRKLFRQFVLFPQSLSELEAIVDRANR